MMCFIHVILLMKQITNKITITQHLKTIFGPDSGILTFLLRLFVCKGLHELYSDDINEKNIQYTESRSSLPYWHWGQVPAEISFSLQFSLSVTAPIHNKTKSPVFRTTTSTFLSIINPFNIKKNIYSCTTTFYNYDKKKKKVYVPFQLYCGGQWLVLS